MKTKVSVRRKRWQKKIWNNLPVLNQSIVFMINDFEMKSCFLLFNRQECPVAVAVAVIVLH